MILKILIGFALGYIAACVTFYILQKRERRRRKEKKNTLKTLLWKLKFVRASLQHRRLFSPQSVRYTVVQSGEK